jgi:hypothetical protein
MKLDDDDEAFPFKPVRLQIAYKTGVKYEYHLK